MPNIQEFDSEVRRPRLISPTPDTFSVRAAVPACRNDTGSNRRLPPVGVAYPFSSRMTAPENGRPY